MRPATSPDRWAQIKSLFATAADLPTEARAVWLAEACGTDDALRAAIEKLLAADAQADAFLESSPFPASLKDQRPKDQLAEGEIIGAYRVIRELGRGGMGTVYLAERATAGFEQRVAIKVIKRGMDSDEVLRRFYAERQILAQLNHPNIARLLDGGQTADGRPYYVMEYIAGSALDEYCRANATPLAERLRLFQDACAAVQYAHQQLVIHRDLKPTNILVTASQDGQGGVLKLLDFGIAKVLAPNTDALAEETLTQAVMLTPAYASPEQLRGARLTTASDVYALGVILYELLTGVSPYASAPRATQAFTKEVCETEPLRPSVQALRQAQTQRLDPELDDIVLMALRKEATRRYGSVEQFSLDIQRYLNGLPVSARPDTWGYRGGKFVRRNRALTAAGLAVALSLTGGIGLTWRQARIAEHERALAERRFGDVRDLANSFVFKYHDELAKLQGATALREMMVSDAKNYLLRLAQDASGDVALQLELAQAWLRIGDVLGKPYFSNLGQTDEALKSYDEARQLAEAALQRAPNHLNARRLLGLAWQSIGSAETRAGQFTAALPHLEKSVSLLQTPATAQPDVNTSTALSRALLGLGDCIIRNQPSPATQKQAIETYQQALRLSEALALALPHEPRRQRAIAIVEQRLGTTLAQLATNEATQKEALAHHQRAADLLTRFAATNVNDASAQRDMYDEYQMKAEVQAQAGDVAGALTDSRKALVFFAKAAAADPQNAEAQRDLATAHYIACAIYQRGQRSAEAASEIRQALAIYEKLAALDPRNAENFSDLMSGYGRLAEAERLLGHQTQAQAAARRKDEYRAKLDALR